MSEMLFVLMILIAAAVAVSNWRHGVYACILVDVMRDPLRKMTSHQSILMTLAAASVWLLVFLLAYQREVGEIRLLGRRLPSFKQASMLLIAAIIPGALLSLILYRKGYILAALGGATFLVPIVAISTGFIFARKPDDVHRLMRFYTVVNAIALIGTPLEYWGSSIPALGGLRIDVGKAAMDWVRYHENYIVKLVSGFYRSPDIMGLHAAHVVVFSAVLTLEGRGDRAKPLWVATALWGAFCLLLSGRRKMLGIPLVFLVVYIASTMRDGGRTLLKTMALLAGAACLGGVVWITSLQGEVSTEYVNYAETFFTQGVERASSVAATSFATLDQAGILGSGLGSATQGNRYVLGAADLKKSWQEDGVSRMFKELGVPGVLMLALALFYLIDAVQRAMQVTPQRSFLRQLQRCLLAVVIANATSFAISHQQYSGDPMTVALVALLFGCLLGAPRLWEPRRAAPLPPPRFPDWTPPPSPQSPTLDPVRPTSLEIAPPA